MEAETSMTPFLQGIALGMAGTLTLCRVLWWGWVGAQAFNLMMNR